MSYKDNSNYQLIQQQQSVLNLKFKEAEAIGKDGVLYFGVIAEPAGDGIVLNSMLQLMGDEVALIGAMIQIAQANPSLKRILFAAVIGLQKTDDQIRQAQGN
jgi:hypothetical protein